MTQIHHWKKLRNLAILGALSVTLSACGFVTAPTKHAVARSAQLGVKTYDMGIETGEEAAIMVRDAAVVGAQIAGEASKKTMETASIASSKVASTVKSASITAVEQAKLLPSKIKSAIDGAEPAPEVATTEID